jgi:hypothetical protein
MKWKSEKLVSSLCAFTCSLCRYSAMSNVQITHNPESPGALHGLQTMYQTTNSAYDDKDNGRAGLRGVWEGGGRTPGAMECNNVGNSITHTLLYPRCLLHYTRIVLPINATNFFKPRRALIFFVVSAAESHYVQGPTRGTGITRGITSTRGATGTEPRRKCASAAALRRHSPRGLSRRRTPPTR